MVASILGLEKLGEAQDPQGDWIKNIRKNYGLFLEKIGPVGTIFASKDVHNGDGNEALNMQLRIDPQGENRIIISEAEDHVKVLNSQQVKDALKNALKKASKNQAMSTAKRPPFKFYFFSKMKEGWLKQEGRIFIKQWAEKTKASVDIDALEARKVNEEIFIGFSEENNILEPMAFWCFIRDPSQRKYIYTNGMYVAEGRRNKGFGTELLDSALANLKREGFGILKIGDDQVLKFSYGKYLPTGIAKDVAYQNLIQGLIGRAQGKGALIGVKYYPDGKIYSVDIDVQKYGERGRSRSGTKNQAMTTNRDFLNSVGIINKIQIGIYLAIRGYTLTELKNYDPELGAYVLRNEIMSMLGPKGLPKGLPTGVRAAAFNWMGSVFLDQTTVDLIKSGDEVARIFLRHEQAHTKYLKEHPDYPHGEQSLVDEMYALLDGSIEYWGREKVFEKKKSPFNVGDNVPVRDLFESVEQNLITNVLVQFPEASEHWRERTRKKIAYAIAIIKYFFKSNQSDLIMGYILHAKDLDDILGSIPLEQQQWLIDAGIQPINHAKLREKWLQFKPNPAQLVKSPGGIDFKAGEMNLQIQNSGGGIKFKLNPAMLRQLQNAPGFVPVITNIQPMTDLRLFLGLKEEPKGESQLINSSHQLLRA